MRTLLPALALILAACGGGQDCPDGTYPTDLGGCELLESSADPPPATGSPAPNPVPNPVPNPAPGPAPSPPTPEPQGATVGEICELTDDCASGLRCIFEQSGDVWGICTETCTAWYDCSMPFWECCDVAGGGSACAPDNWIDNLGLECN